MVIINTDQILQGLLLYVYFNCTPKPNTTNLIKHTLFRVIHQINVSEIMIIVVSYLNYATIPYYTDPVVH